METTYLLIIIITITTDPADVSGLANGATVVVTLATTTEGAEIRYTTDGTDPVVTSTLYTTVFNVVAADEAGKTVTVKAKGFKAEHTASAVASKAIVFSAVDGAAQEAVITAGATVADFANAGITGVTADNLAAVKQAISDDGIAAFDKAAIQAIVDEANAVIAANIAITNALANVGDVELAFGTAVNEANIVEELPVVAGIDYAAVVKGGFIWTITVSDTAGKGTPQEKDITVTVAVDKAALTTAVADANTNKGTAVESEDGTDVEPGTDWVTSAVMTAYTNAIATAQGVLADDDATQGEVDQAVTDLATATGIFDGAKADGTKPDLDQDDVDAAIALVNDADPIASIEIAGGAGADQGDKEAAVKVYLEGLAGMDDLGVEITVAWNDGDGKFDVTVEKDAASDDTQVAVTEFKE